jgi:GDP-4-dehydro-6-deoxy-D-mannose reductase
LNILEACLAHQTKPRILIISSAEIYATTENPINEDTPFLPTTPYAVSKITQDMLGLQYSKQLPIMRVRPFNHTGPGQREDFVAPAFAMQIARIEAGLQEPVIHVRNLLAQIDFTDVRDVVRAYFLILERGTSGEVYNIASGKARAIQSLLDTLLNLSTLTAPPEIKCTGSQIPTTKVGDASRINHTTGWKPQIPFEQTLLDLLNDCRNRVQNSQIGD